jgi:hypothetical protein
VSDTLGDGLSEELVKLRSQLSQLSSQVGDVLSGLLIEMIFYFIMSFFVQNVFFFLLGFVLLETLF